MYDNGAFTGQVSAEMIKDADANMLLSAILKEDLFAMVSVLFHKKL